MNVRKLGLLTALAAVAVVSPTEQSLIWAAPQYGASLIVDADGEVIATFLEHSAGFTNHLYLESPANALGLLFTNQTTPPNTAINLGSFTAGTELVFRMHVVDTVYDYFTGPASRNPDGVVHSYVDEERVPDASYVAFEDIYGGGDLNYFDLNFSVTNTHAEGIVPEPATCLLCGIVGAFLVLSRRPRD